LAASDNLPRAGRIKTPSSLSSPGIERPTALPWGHSSAKTHANTRAIAARPSVRFSWRLRYLGCGLGELSLKASQVYAR